MIVTSFGFFWLIVLMVAFARGLKPLCMCVLFSALFQAGAIFIVNGTSPIAPLTVSCCFYIIAVLIRNKNKYNIQKTHPFLAFLPFWVVILISSLISSVAFVGMKYMEAVNWVSYANYDGDVAFYGLFVLLLYALTAYFMSFSVKFTQKDLDFLISSMVLYVFLVGVWHATTVMEYITRNDFIRDFIFSNATTTSNITYFVDTDSTLRLYSSVFAIRFSGGFMEPSYCAGFLAISFAFFVAKEEMKKKDVFLLLLILLMTLQTFSATAYLMVAVAGILTAFSRKKIAVLLMIVRRGLVIISCAVLALTVFNLWSTIERLIINKTDTYSAYIRGLWDINALATGLETYGLGLGYTNVRGSGLWQTLFASIGVVGTVLFVLFILSVLKYRVSGNYNNRYNQNTCRIMLISVLTGMSVSIGTLDYTMFWLAVFLIHLDKTGRVSEKLI